MKLEIVEGCYNTELLVDGKDVDVENNEVSTEEIRSIISQILPDTNKVLLIDILEMFVYKLGETISAENPCEQCGAWTSITTLNLK